ncbi:hypothetical protein LZ31DRAFT_558118 [Colletotrichum somersetense]|nr:hypothetical protein LZ31DRAFT_558118 [Colletotrichum somersetense]
MAERLRPLQGTSGLEVKCLVASVVYFWLRVKMELWEIADPRKWSDERSLVENVASRFPSPGTTSEARRDLAMSDDFTGANISRFSGVRIKMTDSVDRHLELDINSSSRSSHYLSILFYVFISRRIRRTQTTLKVFCDMEGFLMLFTQKLEDGSPVCPLPPTLYYEVYNSLGLLFPKRKHFKTYFGKTVARKIPFYFFVIGGERNLSCYEVFNARLGELLNLYSNPTIHWWHPLIDRRNKREHFTLWIAIWAFLLGFFSLVTGLVSGIYAVKQYDLGLAAACAESGDHPRMKPYCG